MGSPYLNSGEAIVLTTNRVVVDTVLYDIMLTTERIFLIDNRSARFEPQILLLSAILSVQGGKTHASEPVITLLFRQEEGAARQPVNLVFSQNPNENRKPERDEWVRGLIRLSITQREREAVPETSVVAEVTGGPGLRPSARHGVAPEMVRPLSDVVIRERFPAPLTVIPEEIVPEEIPDTAAPAALPGIDTPVPEPVPEAEEPATAITPVRGTPPRIPAPPARVIIPQIIEELLPEKKKPVPAIDQGPAPAPGFDPEALFRTIPTAVRSMTVTEERRPSQLPVDDMLPDPDDLAHLIAGDQEVPEIIKALHTGATEPETPEQPGVVTPDAIPEVIPGEIPDATPEVIPAGMPDAIPEVIPGIIPEPEYSETTVDGIPEIPAVYPDSGPLVQPVVHPLPETEFLGQNAAETPVRHPIPPAREIRPLRTTLAYAGVLLLVIAIIAAGAVLLIPQGPGQSDNPSTPAPVPVKVTTTPPKTYQPATQVPVTIPPATTRITATITSLPAPTVPQEGVWVRVTSTSGYFGTLGNTGAMRQVTGTGDNFYKVLRSDRPVQVSVQKNDNSGALLSVAVYRNSSLISTRSVTSPMGTVDVLVDPMTGLAPGLSPADVLAAKTAAPAGLQDY